MKILAKTNWILSWFKMCRGHYLLVMAGLWMVKAGLWLAKAGNLVTWLSMSGLAHYIGSSAGEQLITAVKSIFLHIHKNNKYLQEYS